LPHLPDAVFCLDSGKVQNGEGSGSLGLSPTQATQFSASSAQFNVDQIRASCVGGWAGRPFRGSRPCFEFRRENSLLNLKPAQKATFCAADREVDEMRSVKLSSRGIERGASISERDFAFIGNGFEVQCTKFQAVFISPRVHWLLQQDSTLNSIFLETRTTKLNNKRMSELFEDLIKGSSVSVTQMDLCGLIEIAQFLGNTELLDQFPDEGELEPKNVCVRLTKGDCCGRSIDNEIDFAASHFCELDLEDLKVLDVSIVERIVSSPQLRLKDEESLLDFIREFDCDRRILLRHVRSEYLRGDSMSEFLEFLSPSTLDPLIWSSLCCRLLLPVSHPKETPSAAHSRFADANVALASTRHRPNAVEIPMREGSALEGIISYLTEKHGGNVHEKGVVTITSKSVDEEPEADPKLAADLNSMSRFSSKGYPGQWICWDFHEMCVQPTHYTLYACSLKSWVVEGSNDGTNWTEIDRRTNNQVFRATYGISQSNWNIASFTCQAPVEFRFLRLTQTGPRHNGNDYLVLQAVEFFGTLYACPGSPSHCEIRY
jgi:hypothetical protein